MVDPHLCEAKLAAIGERLERVSARLPADRPSFLSDRDTQELVAFNLFLAFQYALDLAAHIIADSALGQNPW